MVGQMKTAQYVLVLPVWSTSGLHYNSSLHQQGTVDGLFAVHLSNALLSFIPVCGTRVLKDLGLLKNV